MTFDPKQSDISHEPRRGDTRPGALLRESFIGLVQAALLRRAITLKALVFVVAALVTISLTSLFGDAMKLAEERFGALGWTLFADRQVEERLTIVAIDERSLAEIGPWPWPREQLARLSENMHAMGVAMQLFDIVLPEGKLGDEALVSALSQSRSVLGQIPILPQQGQVDGMADLASGYMTGALSGVVCGDPVPSAVGYLANHKRFGGIAKGHITPIVDGDGVVRKQPPLICVDGKAYPSLSLQALIQGISSDLLGDEPKLEFVPGEGLLAPAWYLQVSDYLGYRVPVDEQGNVRVSYRQHPGAFRVISAADVLKKPVNDSELKGMLAGAWVLVGATAFGLGDVVPTPHSGMAPGVELQARLLVGMLDGQMPYEPRFSTAFLLLESIGFAALLLLLSMGRRSIVGLPAAALFLPAIALLVHIQLVRVDLWLGWVEPALFGVLAAVMLALMEHKRVRLERHRVYSNLSSYLPAEAAEEIALNLPSGSIEAKRQELVLLSADLRNFSAYEAAHAPEEAAALLHCFFVRAAAVVVEHGGAVAEFTGDSILASWSVDSGKNTALDALVAAQEMCRVMDAIMPAPIALGVSIEKGPVLVGSIGPSYRRTHTLLGDTVTLTLRIQEMTQELAQPVLVGESAARALRGEALVSQGAFLLDGLRSPQVIYAPGNVSPAAPLSDSDDLNLEPGFRVIPGGKD